MRKNYFVKLVNYMKNVYHDERGLIKLSDGRVNPTDSNGQVILVLQYFFKLPAPPIPRSRRVPRLGKEALGS